MGIVVTEDENHIFVENLSMHQGMNITMSLKRIGLEVIPEFGTINIQKKLLFKGIIAKVLSYGQHKDTAVMVKILPARIKFIGLSNKEIKIYLKILREEGILIYHDKGILVIQKNLVTDSIISKIMATEYKCKR